MTTKQAVAHAHGDDLSARVYQARVAYDALPPVERALHDADQKRSWVRGQTGRDPGEDILAAEVRRLRSILTTSPEPPSVEEIAGIIRHGYKPVRPGKWSDICILDNADDVAQAIHARITDGAK